MTLAWILLVELLLFVYYNRCSSSGGDEGETESCGSGTRSSSYYFWIRTGTPPYSTFEPNKTDTGRAPCPVVLRWEDYQDQIADVGSGFLATSALVPLSSTPRVG